jgi:ribosomal protein S18 acetylase RimI-like enzyme
VFIDEFFLINKKLKMKIRRAKKKDLDQLAALFDKYRIFYKQDADIKSAKAFLKNRMKKDESVIFVAEEEKKLLGFTQLFPIFTSVGMRRTWLLNDLYVDKAARNKGVAKALLKAAREFGEKSNSKWLLLQTAADNFTAQKVYERMGWVKETDFFYRLDLM